MNNSTTQAPATAGGNGVVVYVLVPFLLLTVTGIAVALVMYIRRRRRTDRLRHQLLPIYSYDPSEEVNEVEQEMFWGEEDTKIVQGWARSYQQQRPLLANDVNA
ncbi:small integral membrane protein 29-like [Pholidichthys leucotaenia]